MGFSLQDGGSHDSLSIAKSAVAGADLAMLEDLESLFFESGAEQARETTIVHASAGE